MGRARFISKSGDFFRKNAAFKDMVQDHMAQDIEVALKTRSGMPVRHGIMKGSTHHFRSPRGGYRVEIDIAYAAYQERGRRADGSHVVRNYTTAGTSSGFFARAIGSVMRNKMRYFDEARRALNL